MFTKLFQIDNRDNGRFAVDWAVFGASVVAIGLAVALIATHDTNTLVPQPESIVVVSATEL